MIEIRFKPCARVMLACGGTSMLVDHTVRAPAGNQVHCMWQANGRTHRAVYPEHLLVDDELDLEVVTVGLPPATG